MHVIHGDTRSGKTRYIYTKHGCHNVFTVKVNSSGKLWFDGYNGQKVLLLNEFYGQLRAGALLDLLDNYRQTIEVKGSSTVSNWDTVYITSNCSPTHWYNYYENIPLKVEQAIFARIDSITELHGK